jgi:hypothetical protein
METSPQQLELVLSEAFKLFICLNFILNRNNRWRIYKCAIHNCSIDAEMRVQIN